MNATKVMDELVGRAFINYAKKCLKHARRDYFKRQDRYLYRITFLGDFIFDVAILNLTSTSNHFPNDDYILLLQASKSLKLSLNERKILFMKFFEDMTDKEIAIKLGVSRQAVTKTKIRLMKKLQNFMEE